MSIETIVLIMALVLLVGSWPAWPHSKSWGYGPTGVFTVLLVIFLVWAIAGGRPLFRRSWGDDIRSAGHDAGDSVRRAVQ